MTLLTQEMVKFVCNKPTSFDCITYWCAASTTSGVPCTGVSARDSSTACHAQYMVVNVESDARAVYDRKTDASTTTGAMDVTGTKLQMDTVTIPMGNAVPTGASSTSSSLPLPISAPLMPTPTASPMTPVVSGPQSVTGPVTITIVTTTVPAGAQPPTLLPAPMMNALSVCDATGIALQIKISNHVAITVQNKVWQYQFVDLGYLINTEQDPDDVTYDFLPDHHANKISFKPAHPQGKIFNFAALNNAFYILTELVSVKWPDNYLDMVQYAVTMPDLQGKFAFQQVCL